MTLVRGLGFRVSQFPSSHRNTMEYGSVELGVPITDFHNVLTPILETMIYAKSHTGPNLISSLS